MKPNYLEETIIIEEFEKLSDTMFLIDKQIKDDAFSDLADLSEEEKNQMAEKYKVVPWKYLFAKINNEYVGRVVLDKRNVKLGSRNVYGVGIGGLAVKSVYQKQGIGRMLMNRLIEVCKSSNIDFIFLNAGEELHRYYESFGFSLHKYRFKGISGKEYVEDDGMVLVLNKNIQSDLSNNSLDIGLGNV